MDAPMHGMESSVGLEFPKNPLLCPICHDYFTEPCILSCYHTFCARCLRGREQDRKLVCPFCRQPTMLKDGTALPPPDTLMRQLIDIANSENPPCSNCDKRDRQNMYYCNTCGQALCCLCRDNTHRAKMFSSHEILHMSKCMKEPKKCPQHGEHYIMYCPLQNGMLCVNCFRDLPSDVRAQCVDIDTAYSQAAKRLERGQNAIMDLQTSVRDGIIALKGLMDELRRNMDSEKHTINTFCQGMQEAMAKTHATMIMEVQRQFECKERIYRSQLLVLGTVMPVLQLHLVLCTTFTAAANKYQFLELSPALTDRLSAVGNLSQPVRSLQSSQIKTNYRSEFAQCLEPWIGPAAVSQHQSELAAASRMYESVPPATKKQQSALKHKLLEGDSSFASHCRSFESQIRELNQQFNVIKEKVGELHKDILALRKAQTPPLVNRYDLLTRECLHLDQSLERQQQELDRMATAFDASWEEQLWRIRVEQEVFSCQRADVNTLRNELKHLSQVATQLEPYIRSITPASQSQMSGQSEQSQSQSEQAQHLASLLEQFGIIQQSEASLGKIPRSRSRVLGHLLEKMRPTMQERERSKSAGQTDKPCLSAPPHKPQAPHLKKPFMSSSQQISIDRLEAQIKEKLHDIISRRQSSTQQPASKTDAESAAADRKMSKDDRKLSKTDLDSIGSGKQRIMYKKIGKSCDKINGGGSKSDSECKKAALRGGGGGGGGAAGEQPEYQRISDACGGSQGMKKALLHGGRSSPSSPKGGKGRGAPTHQQHQHRTTHQPQSAGGGQHNKQHRKKVYPYSDSEDNVFYGGSRSGFDSADSFSGTSSRRSSYDGGGGGGGPSPQTDKTLVVVINRRNKSVSSAGGGSTPTSGASVAAQKQRSWETFPPKRRHHHACAGGGGGKERTGAGRPPSPLPPPMQQLRKADSFEGHEEAVKSLVAAVQETRRKPKAGSGN